MRSLGGILSEGTHDLPVVNRCTLSYVSLWCYISDIKGHETKDIKQRGLNVCMGIQVLLLAVILNIFVVAVGK